MKKKGLYILLILSLSFLSCSTLSWTWDKMVKARISVKEALDFKEKIDKTTNPARRELMLKDVKKKLIELKDVLVKDIVASTNIYYNYAVVVEVPHEKGVIAFYIYADNDSIDDVAKLKKGKSRINVIGYFGRYFEILSDAYINIEILDADIDFLKHEKSAVQEVPIAEKKKKVE